MGDRTGGSSTLTTAYDPGRDAAERYPDWVIRHRPIGVPELMCLRRQVILIDSAQTWPAKKAGLAHAIAHLDLRHCVTPGHINRRQEREAEEMAARRMISTAALTDAIRWCGERWSAVAEHLDVDERLLRTRLDTMFGPEMLKIRVDLGVREEV